jgi:uncharacterized protein
MLGSLSHDQIDGLLHEQYVGRIGCHTDGRTYVVPVTYVYQGDAIYAHSADGMKLRMMRANPNVCFEVEHLEDMANWRTVIAWGTFEELHGGAARAAMGMLVARLLPIVMSETATMTDSMGVDEQRLAQVRGRKAVPFRVVLTEKTGRFERRASVR